MERITTILPRESARLDAEQLERLYTTLGEVEADNVLSRAMEEMALRIEQSEKLFDAGNSSEMRRTICSLIRIADQVGMHTVSRVSGDVLVCLDRGDWISLGATFARLVRCSDQSLTAIWDLQDITV